MSALDLAPQTSSSSGLVAGGLDIDDKTSEDAFGDAPLEREAGRVRLGHHLEEALRNEFRGDTLVQVLAAAREMLEEMADDWGGPALSEVFWDEASHPRWPKDTPGGLGGQFMRVGQRFALGGVEYDVAHVFPGGLIAHTATHGVKGQPKTVEFTTQELKAEAAFKPDEMERAGLKAGAKAQVLAGATRPPAEPIHGAKQHTDSSSFTGTVIDPYVDPATHDPSIPIPQGSQMTAEEWKRFGRVDQVVYSQLMERFGAWKPDGAQKLVDSLKSKADASSKSLLHGAYSSQFGSSTGFTLSLHSVYSAIKSAVKGSPDVEKARTQFEAARYWQAEAAGGLRWDLYNRVRSPDLSLFHGTSEPSLFANDIIKGGKPVFSGLSQSQKFRPGFFGSSRFMTPMAIRHIVLATTSAEMYASSGGFKGEQEVAVADAFRADARSMVVPDSGSGTGLASSGYTHAGPSGLQKKWLEGITQHGVGGWALAMFRDSYKDSGGSLPVPPEPPMIQMDKAGGKQWVTPPKDATEFAYVDGVKTPIPDLKYANVDAKGSPVSMQVKQMVEQGLLKPGDFLEGMQGTRYLIIEDKGDQYLGLAYYKVTDLGTAVAGTTTKNNDTGQTTSAFAGHTLYSHGGSDVYGFEGGGAKAFKLLKGHYDLPTISEAKGSAFNPQAWVEDDPKSAVFVKDFKVGEKFKVGQGFYEVTDHLSNGNAKIKNLEDNEPGQINGTYKSPKLLLKSGYTEAGVALLDPADFFKGQPNDIGQGFDTLTQGDVILVGGTPYTVMSKTQDGKIQAADQTGKLKLLDATAKYTPLFPKPAGWAEPQVGDTLAIDGEKAQLTKLLKDGTLQFRKAKGGVVKMHADDPRLLGIFHASDYTVGGKEKLKNIAPGTLLHGGTGEKIKPYLVVKQQGKTTVLRNLDTGDELEVSSSKSFSVLSKKQTAPEPSFEPASTPQTFSEGPFDLAQWEAGPEKSADELQVGEKFSLGSDQFEVVKPTQIDAEGIVKRLNGPNAGQEVVFNGSLEFKVTTLVPKKVETAEEVPLATKFDPSNYVAGKPILATETKPGDIVQSHGGAYFQIVLPPSKDGSSMKFGAAISLSTGKKMSVAHDIAFKAKLEPKTKAATPYDALVPGDPVSLLDLNPGDQFKGTGSDSVWQVVGPGDASKDEPSLQVVPVFADGTVGAKSKGVLKAQTVTFHAHAHDVMPVQSDEAMKTVLPSPADLPSPPDFEPFKWHKGGHGTVYTKLQEMAPGTVFIDKNGKGWKIAGNPGPTPIITDESGKLFTADGTLRGRAIKVGEGFDSVFDKMQGVQAAPLESVQHTEAAAAVQHIVSNDDAKSIDELGLGIGDSVQLIGGPTVKLVAASPGEFGTIYSVYDTAAGKKLDTPLDSHIVPLGYSKSEAPKGLFGDVIEPVPATPPMPEDLSGDPDDWEPTGYTKKLADMNGGETYLITPHGKSPQVVHVTAKDPAHVSIANLTDGHTATYPIMPSDAGSLLTLLKPKVPTTDDVESVVSPASYPGAHDNTSAQIPLSMFKPGAEFTLEEHPGYVFKLSSLTLNGKTAVAYVEKEGPGDTWAPGVPISFSAQTVPMTWGVQDSHALTASPSSGGFSGDPGDYAEAGSALLKNLQPGDFFKTAKGMVFKVASKDEHVSTVVGPDGVVKSGIPNTLGVTKLEPTTDDEDDFGPAEVVPYSDLEDETGESVMAAAPHAIFAPKVPASSLKEGDKFIFNGNVLIHGGEGKQYWGTYIKGTKPGTSNHWTVNGNAMVQKVEPGMGSHIPGSFVKIVKPGNTSGKTARVIDVLPDGKYLVRFADGKGLSVSEDWIQPLAGSPTYKTKDALAFPTQQVGELPEGTIIMAHDYGYSQLAEIGEQKIIEGSSKPWVEVTYLSSGKTGKLVADQKVPVVMSAEKAAAMKRATTKFIEAGPHVSDVQPEAGTQSFAASNMPDGFVPNEGADAKTFLDLGLQPGDKIVNYKGEPETVKKVYGTPGTNGHVYDTINDVTGQSGVYGTGGKPSGYWKVPSATAEDKGYTWDFTSNPELEANLAATLGDITGSKVDAQTLNVGDHFSSAGATFVVLSKSVAGTVQAHQLGAGGKVAFGPHQEVAPINAAVVQKPLYTLPVGAKFTTGPLSGVPGGQVWEKQGVGEADEGDQAWATNTVTGSSDWMGKTLPVTPLPDDAQGPLNETDVPVGGQLTMATVQPGDHYAVGGVGGNVYKVLEKKPQPGGGYVLTSQLVAAGHAMPSSDVGKVYTFPVVDGPLGAKVNPPAALTPTKNAFDEIPPLTTNYPDGKTLDGLGLGAGDYFVFNGSPFKMVGHDGGTGYYVATNLETDETKQFDPAFQPTSWAKTGGAMLEPDVFEPFKYHKGGTGQKNVHLKTLKVGAAFTGKTSKMFVVSKTEKEGAAPGFVHYKLFGDDDSQEYVTSGDHFVREVH